MHRHAVCRTKPFPGRIATTPRCHVDAPPLVLFLAITAAIRTIPLDSRDNHHLAAVFVKWHLYVFALSATGHHQSLARPCLSFSNLAPASPSLAVTSMSLAAANRPRCSIYRDQLCRPTARPWETCPSKGPSHRAADRIPRGARGRPWKERTLHMFCYPHVRLIPWDRSSCSPILHRVRIGYSGPLLHLTVLYTCIRRIVSFSGQRAGQHAKQPWAEMSASWYCTRHSRVR